MPRASFALSQPPLVQMFFQFSNYMLDKRVGGLSWGCEMKIQGLTWDDSAITLNIKEALTDYCFTQNSHRNDTPHIFSHSFVEHTKTTFSSKNLIAKIKNKKETLS